MENTMHDGNVLLLDKYDSSFQRFEIVVFNFNGEKLIKRIIGLPGEHIKYVDGELYVNNKLIDEDYGKTETNDFDLNDLNYTFIPTGYYLVLGDNRGNSIDSRYIGLIKKDDILGTVKYSVVPLKVLE
jgi:signal peptidase I